MTITELLNVAKQNDIVYPRLAHIAASKAGIPFYIICAFLMQESDGGNNVYGHDESTYKLADGTTLIVPRPFWGHGKVTQNNYKEYLVERDMFVDTGIGRRMQGVGPMQLTWYKYQDEADRLGGCWEPHYNIWEGAKILARLKAAGNTWHEVAKAYNGKESYADEMDKRFTHWHKLLGGQ